MSQSTASRSYRLMLVWLVLAMGGTGLSVYQVVRYRTEQRLAAALGTNTDAYARISELSKSLAETSAALDAARASTRAEAQQAEDANRRATIAEGQVKKNADAARRTAQAELKLEEAEEEIQRLNAEISRLQKALQARQPR